ncbi:MAG: tetratricopeptide repeat protein [Gemmatimonadetes bacterium]|nr:tetratricopeptide repeat protein [Gemmatimonadota bacterium]
MRRPRVVEGRAVTRRRPKGTRPKGKRAGTAAASPAPSRAMRDGWTRAWPVAVRLATRAAAAAIVVVALGALLWFAGLAGPASLPAPRGTPVAASRSHDDFVGAEPCKECHAAQFTAWQASTHGHAGGDASPSRVIAAFGGAPIRFRDATVTPRVVGGRYEFVVAQDGEAPTVFTVDGVIGGGHMEGGGTQGFVHRASDGTMRFLPFDWSRQGHAWFCNTNSRANAGWVPITPALRLADCGDWPLVRVLGELPRYANCQSCHASQLTVSLDTMAHRWRTQATGLDINCEACHGPARRHVALARAGAMGADIGLEPLATRDKDASLAVCFQCHAVKDRVRDGFLSGDPLASYYSVNFPSLGDRPLTADGRTRTFAYQEGHRFSDCYVNGGMTCTSCHDPHSQTYRDVTGTPLPGRFDDRQCTSCHAAKASAPAAHTHHAPASEGSRCTACHMPYLQQPETGHGAVRYARSDHTISIPRPAWDSTMGVPNACATCHAGRATAALESQVAKWWGAIKPVPAVVAGQARVTAGMSLDEAWPLLLGARGDTAGDRRVAARFAGEARFLEQFGGGDALPAGARERLAELALHPDLDVRALALATLHQLDGARWSTQRLLAHALRAAGSDETALRARWALALGFLGDRSQIAGEWERAIATYERALAVTPRDPRLLLNLANALRDGGDATRAVARYRESLTLDPAQPIALVNLGIAQKASGDTAAAVASWERAARLDAGEPLAPFNLATVELARGRTDEARRLYETAVSLDGSLAAAHFQLARLAILRGDPVTAESSLRRGLRFDSTNSLAREAYDRLRGTGGR